MRRVGIVLSTIAVLFLLFDSSGKQLLESTGNTDSEEIKLTGLPAGTYYVQVTGYKGAVQPRYQLTISAPDGLRSLCAIAFPSVSSAGYRANFAGPLSR